MRCGRAVRRGLVGRGGRCGPPAAGGCDGAACGIGWAGPPLTRPRPAAPPAVWQPAPPCPDVARPTQPRLTALRHAYAWHEDGGWVLAARGRSGCGRWRQRHGGRAEATVVVVAAAAHGYADGAAHSLHGVGFVGVRVCLCGAGTHARFARAGKGVPGGRRSRSFMPSWLGALGGSPSCRRRRHRTRHRGGGDPSRQWATRQPAGLPTPPSPAPMHTGAMPSAPQAVSGAAGPRRGRTALTTKPPHNRHTITPVDAAACA